MDTNKDKKIRIAINGCGRIGRAFIKLSVNNPEINIVAVNDLAEIENIAYLLKYDSAQGKSDLDIKVDGESLVVNENEIKYLSEKDPSKLPWKDLEIDIVVEATGVFNSYEKSNAHITAGAKRVVISAPVKDSSQSIVDSLGQMGTDFAEQNPSENERLNELSHSESGVGVPNYRIEGKTILMGINEEDLKTCDISSNASCTTNAGSPVLEILKNTVGIEKAMLNTIHGYTASQALVDGPHKKDPRRGRAAAQNIVLSTTGAAVATAQVQKDLKGKFDGMAIRVPVVSGSVIDITFVSKKETSIEEVNDILIRASKDSRWKGIFTVTDEALVSTDILGNLHASIVDLNFTKVVGGNLVKVLAWYDNEIGYTSALMKHVISAGKSL